MAGNQDLTSFGAAAGGYCAMTTPLMADGLMGYCNTKHETKDGDNRSSTTSIWLLDWIGLNDRRTRQHDDVLFSTRDSC
eukprot:scaffold298078_cov24-Attheya_sp.AAC.1